MIHLLFSSFEAILQACNEKPLEEVFSVPEQEEFSGLKVPARKREWQASRIGAKLLVQRACPEYSQLPLPTIRLIRETSGAPRLEGEGFQIGQGCFSQSHSNGFLFSAFSSEEERLGVDLEKVEARSAGFVNDYFTETERVFIHGVGVENQALASTLIWSAKEAVLKAALLGLNVDTRRVEVLPGGNLTLESTWQPVDIHLQDLGLESSSLYWRRQGDFVLTLCVDSNQAIVTSWVKI
jgi:phosphopantetheinyl transferase